MILEREPERATLTGLLDLARAGDGGLAVVVAPAGIGKTTLLADLAATARDRQVRVLAAQGSQFEREFSFGLVRQLFEPLLAGAAESERSALLAGAAGQAAAVLGAADPAAGERGDFAILHGLYWLTANLCQDRPLLLCVDDLQWSDHASVRFLAHLLPRLRDLPVLVLAATRPEDPDADLRPVRQLLADPRGVAVRPGPLGEAAVARLLSERLGRPVGPAFARACHAATQGTPFLVAELGRSLAAAGVEPDDAHVDRVAAIGSAALGHMVSRRLAHLSPGATAFARAMSLVEDNSALADVIAVSGLALAEATDAMTELERADILRAGGPGRVAFDHPLMRSVVYDAQPVGARIAGHALAARVLATAGHEPERVAGHLLRVPAGPVPNPAVTAALRQAAADALTRGSPDSAHAYLRRCLDESLPAAERLALLIDLGALTQQSDMAASADYLGRAADLATDPGDRVRVADMLARALHFVGRNAEAVAVCRAARREPDLSADARQRLDAQLLVLAMADRSITTSGSLAEARLLVPEPGTGGRLLDCIVGVADAFDGRPEATERTLRALRGLDVRTAAHGLEIYLSGCIALLMADHPDGMAVLDGWVAEAHQHGSTVLYAYTKAARGIGWYWRGALAEAEADASDALEIGEASLTDVRPAAAACLANTLMAQGRDEEASMALTRAGVDPGDPDAGFLYTLVESQAALHAARGDAVGASRWAALCGERYAASGGVNPARVAWRSVLAAAQHALGDVGDARRTAAAELDLARRWGAPRTLGRALRVSGLVEGGEAGLALLRASVEVLADSPARLEYATALVDLGAALRRAGRRGDSRPELVRGVEVAEVCGAGPLALRGRRELRAAGSRMRPAAVAGPAALTPSEARVVELAVEGGSNRDIAQALYVTAKTVEVHLSNAYRKLGVSGRRELLTRHRDRPA
ncbi:transcriptional regulator [Longispora fulva]|uniref:DNA-binding CsgD family transcriptional regulator n=1 Tax=Longispora fulva TaxID=619741 RepID=A0A8J7GI20_9ACTN|nr:LuxR family transcriptional regulator [Longispora fulva]MBG6137032.1 DNA-binding CsgD family transcriptional regulator [Longispora fulva]GIG61614.1 transcriptional regulator [Longispora fulva]